MIVQMNKDKSVLCDTDFLCNQYDNESANILVKVAEELVNEGYFYYVICKSPNGTVFAVPVLLENGNELNYMVGSGLSQHSGIWEFCIVIKNVEITDGEVGTDGLIAISNYFTGRVEKSIIDAQQLEEQPEDPNLIIVYDNMQALITSVNTALANGDFIGPQGIQGVGVPEGGLTGQVLVKASGDDYDTKWANQSGGGGGDGSSEIIVEDYDTDKSYIETKYIEDGHLIIRLEEK